MIRYRDGLLFAALALSGCQSFNGLFQNRFASTEEYSPEETMAMSQPLPEAQLAGFGSESMPDGTPGGNPMALASYNSANTPQQAGGDSVASLVEAGQNAIRNAGQNNPAALQNARQLFEQALMMDATNGQAHHGIAIASDLQEDWASAEQHYKQALAVDPSNPSLLNDLGYSYLLQNRYDESQQYLNRAIQLDARHERAHLNLALLSLRRGDTAAAQNTLARVFSPQEVSSNLARLQQDLQNILAKSNQGMLAGSMQANGPTAIPGQPGLGNTAVYPVSQSQPADWNANRPSNSQLQAPGFPQQTGMNQTGMNPPVAGINSFPSGQGYPTVGTMNQPQPGSNTAMSIDPALRASPAEKPISIYPPGVVKNEASMGNSAGTQHTAAYPQAQPMNGMAGSYQSGQQSASGLQIPGAQNNAGMNATGQDPFPLANFGAAGSYPAMNQPYGAPSNTAALGLNVGPGMPFPVGGVPVAVPQPFGQQPAAGQSPASQPAMGQPLDQYGNPSMAQPLLQHGMNSGAASNGFGQANYGAPNNAASGGNAFPLANQPGQFGTPANGSYGQPLPNSVPTSSVSYGQPIPGSNHNPASQYGQPAVGNGTPSAGSSAHYGQPQNSAFPSSYGNPAMGGQQNMMPAQGPASGQQLGPMQQFEQQQMNRMNDQYQQTLQQMNSRGFPGQ